jgi:hypothetical protein
MSEGAWVQSGEPSFPPDGDGWAGGSHSAMPDVINRCDMLKGIGGDLFLPAMAKDPQVMQAGKDSGGGWRAQ